MLHLTDKQIAAARRALDRAYAEGIHKRFLRIDGHGLRQTTAIYLTPTGDRYHVMLPGCTCPAGCAGYICKHQIALADLTGQLDHYIPNVYGDAADVA